MYGSSKLVGERALGASDAIVRIAWVCGFYGSNMVKTILRLAEQPQLKFVDDQIGNPTFADDAAEMIVRIATEKSLIGGTTSTNTLRTYLSTGVQDAQINVVLIPAATTS